MAGNFIAWRAYYNHGRGKTQKARALYEKAFEQGCDRSRYYAAYGVLLLREWEYENALRFLEEKFEWFETDPKFRTLKPKKGKKQKINKRYRKADKANMLLNLGLAQWKTGDAQTAADSLARAYSFYKNSNVLSTFAYMLIVSGDLTGDYSKAEKVNLEALDYEAEDAVTQDNLGQLRYRQGRYAEAKEHFEKALKLRPAQVDSKAFLAYTHHALGDDALAAELADEALSMEFKPLGTVTREEVEAFRRSL